MHDRRNIRITGSHKLIHLVALTVFIFAVLAVCRSGSTSAQAQDTEPKQTPRVPGVTGVGGLFFKAKDPKMMAEWYEKHLGITKQDAGYMGFTWRDRAHPERVGYTSWGAFASDTTYFDPSDKTFMFNYRVNDLDGLLAKLEAEGVQVVGEVQRFDYGDFGWILDPEGTKIELWEPVDLIQPLDEKDLVPAVIDPLTVEVRAALKRYYEDFSARDWDKFAANFHEGAVLATVWTPPGAPGNEPVVMMSTIPQFVEQAPQGPGSQPIFEERMMGAEINVMGDLAQAWVMYEAKFGTEEQLMEWRGIDSFTLLNHEGVWRIVSIAYVSLDGE